MNILIVEADAWFEGHRRVRVAKGASLDDIHSALFDQLRLSSNAISPNQATHIDMSISMFNPSTQCIVPLRHGDQIQSHTRVFVAPSQSTPPPVLAIASRSFGLAFEKGEFLIHGTPLYIGEVGNTGKGTGLTIWDGSVVLAKYLEHATSSFVQNEDSVRGKRVLELGAGTGLVGLAAAVCGASHVTLTDLAYTLDNLSANVRANASSIAATSVDVAELDWFKAPPLSLTDNVDVVVGSDIVWVESLIDALVATIASLLTCDHVAGRKKAMLLAHQTRSAASDTRFFRLLDAHHLVVTMIHPPASILPLDKVIRLFRIQPPLPHERITL
ncbi:hypothetical protein DYB30_007350 [Aphanomyces astaci]|uniref:FAM86 N-terminal domain-containing protein n=1 Tax=Aphanomyces astaci TaxID=112090 RepID=A0A397E0C2_APHAT|nr:hypothetical protein DYB34_008554 [Aphanomyces astaci]RHY71229.1 hypothetical protein DYB30_007350 [Aphanomyces astaci]RHZ08047.1 hypothetical protein DYB31_000263 [Aphanomyces astaci]